MEKSNEPAQCHPLPRTIGQPAQRVLAAAGLHNLEMVAQVRESDLLALHGIGPKAIRILKSAMQEAGIDW